ncbi:MAG TPA: MopE-related protein, partial [Polyangiaceae bacterium LLY-WYZ-15_(1-7)]|nr:MopE-related protein [Polyangiaceae bacterium LLY-WYZ-15_(1-7)]
DGAFDGVCVGAVEPGTELCNTLDDDCDGRTDEGTDPDTVCGSDLGACSPGRLRCVGGTLSCEGGTGPAAESCNSIDDDCDGTTDESVPTDGPCGETEGECAAGVRTCVAGSFTCVGAVGPRTEICDGVDNDCDASTDEGDPGGGAACGTDEGACSPGTTLCDGGRIVCDGDTGPVAELCNTVDDDCDGLIDESNPEGGTACGDTDVGECAFGAEVCRMGTLECVGATGPSAEICDGLDNDCDGRTDEDNPEGGMACGDDTGECSPGTTLCTGGELICDGAVGPTEEVCNGLDDDCDGVADDGLDVGAPCGSDTGECVPGVRACVDGAIVCEGELGPIPEECDALDNDCDGAVDEELAAGETCGDTEGVCMPGMIQCVDGAEICVGGVPAAPETCDCEDNDCDGAIDEDPDSGAICPGESACVDCQCALPCSTSEFGTCPTGRVEVEIEGECYCVAPRCNPETCGEETVERDGVVRCAPDEEGVPVCECIANECTFPCDGVVCEAPTVCNPGTGRCVVDDCTGLGCPAGELCEVRTGDCIPDPCLDVECAADEACRDGVCETSCGSVSCDPGDRCTGGECVDDLCEGVGCPSDQRCDEESGECVDDLCFMVTCPEGTVCNPETGGCGEDPCLRLRCPESDRCFEGECVPRPMMTDAGPMDMDAGPTEADAGPGEEEEDPEDRVLAAGGGGCTCRIVGPDDDGPPPLGWLALLVPAVLVWRRRNGGTR